MPAPETPEPPGGVTAPETAVRPQNTTTINYRTGDLQAGRNALLQEFVSIPFIEHEHLINSVLPSPFNKDQVRTVIEQLRETAAIKKTRWRAFPNNPSKVKGNEDKAFDVISDIFEALREAVVSLEWENIPIHHYRSSPHRTPSSVRCDTSRPDGQLMRVSREYGRLKGLLDKEYCWEDIAVPFEYKKKSSPMASTDNVIKILWGLHHILRNDACRRFVFGVTVEDCNMRVWVVNRGFATVTRPIDFVKEIELTAHIFLSLLYGSETEVGWDPTIRRTSDHDQLDIDIFTTPSEKQTFRTVRVLSDFAADGVLGRGTRVFEARKGDDTVALKDVWLSHGYENEGSIQEKLFAEIANRGGEAAKANASQYFLTVALHGVVYVDEKADDTLHLIMRGQGFPNEPGFYTVPTPTERLADTAVGNAPAPLPSILLNPKKRTPNHRVHYRIAFREVGQVLHNLKDLGDQHRALAGATKALQILHEHNFVHRDVSSGNILLVEGAGRLSDLEYVKAMDKGSSHESRTGTVNYMAVEVEERDFLFYKEQPPKDPFAEDYHGHESLPIIPFRYNPLHDLESIWWIAVWTIFLRQVVGRPPQDHLKQREAYKALFPGYVGATSRQLAFKSRTKLSGHLESLSPEFGLAGDLLGAFAQKLRDCYENAEAKMTSSGIDTQAWSNLDIHRYAIRVFETLPLRLDFAIEEFAPLVRQSEDTPVAGPSNTKVAVLSSEGAAGDSRAEGGRSTESQESGEPEQKRRQVESLPEVRRSTRRAKVGVAGPSNEGAPLAEGGGLVGTQALKKGQKRGRGH